ncbi:MAG: phosphate/phosphite/phosphonate ABC transporter substrate-binding protein [Chthoniobacter sp.]|nr:phosphate/phosphite/phosphonate ABC transporter substrate-binding protein [Chthoniobacter sp.]
MALTLFFGGCGKAKEEPMPSRLRIEVPPDRSREVVEKRNSGLVQYLSAKLKMPCELVIAESYEQFVEDLANGRAELGLFGGYTYVLANQRTKLVPLVMRDVDRHFTTMFFTSPGNRGRTLESFRGQRLAFGPQLSTSGHLMARDFLQQKGIAPEQFFEEVRYSKGHDDTARMVREGEVGLGAANAITIKRMITSGELQESEIIPLFETPPYADYVWAMRESTPASLRTAVRAAFLSLTKLDETEARVLADQDAGIFLPVMKEDFRKTEEAVRKLRANGSTPKGTPRP